MHPALAVLVYVVSCVLQLQNEITAMEMTSPKDALKPHSYSMPEKSSIVKENSLKRTSSKQFDLEKMPTDKVVAAVRKKRTPLEKMQRSRIRGELPRFGSRMSPNFPGIRNMVHIRSPISGFKAKFPNSRLRISGRRRTQRPYPRPPPFPGSWRSRTKSPLSRPRIRGRGTKRLHRPPPIPQRNGKNTKGPQRPPSRPRRNGRNTRNPQRPPHRPQRNGKDTKSPQRPPSRPWRNGKNTKSSQRPLSKTELDKKIANLRRTLDARKKERLEHSRETSKQRLEPNKGQDKSSKNKPNSSEKKPKWSINFGLNIGNTPSNESPTLNEGMAPDNLPEPSHNDNPNSGVTPPNGNFGPNIGNTPSNESPAINEGMAPDNLPEPSSPNTIPNSGVTPPNDSILENKPDSLNCDRVKCILCSVTEELCNQVKCSLCPKVTNTEEKLTTQPRMKNMTKGPRCDQKESPLCSLAQDLCRDVKCPLCSVIQKICYNVECPLCPTIGTPPHQISAPICRQDMCPVCRVSRNECNRMGCPFCDARNAKV